MAREPFIYLVLTSSYGNGKPALAMAREAIAGGVTWLQMREKGKRRKDLLALGRALRYLCYSHDVTFIVNDDPILARRLKADGVHLGQEDLIRFPIPAVRRLLGKNKIIGISTHSLKEVKEAVKQDVNYIAFGPIFPTPNKPYFVGTNDIEEVLRISPIPVVIIGGIDLNNIKELQARGVKYFAMIRGIIEAGDIKCRVEKIREILKRKG